NRDWSSDVCSSDLVAFRQQLSAQFGDRVLSHPAMDAALEAFVNDPKNFYNAYINGKMSFAEQRLNRVQDAMTILQLNGSPDEELWIVGYEEIVTQHWAPFDDAVPLVEALEDLGIAYGAATNNTTDYQSYKLEQAGIPFDVVVRTGITGHPEPNASMCLEGALWLTADPAHTVMVGDDVINDGRGARDAGLIAVLVDRNNSLAVLDRVYKVSSLRGVRHIDC